MIEEPGAPDTFRKKHGLKGEMALFRAADSQHRAKKHSSIDIDCDTCMMILRNIDRLKDEFQRYTNSGKP